MSDHFTTLISAYWPVVLSLIGLIVWLVKLEFRTNSNSGRIKKLEAKEDSLILLSEKVTAIDAKLSVLIPDYNGK